ncbi:MAG: FkbM family methyltransferase [Gammaproteobacteria bacterium]|nr:FkbM family methyltransferase [Gammaproteobacteria bacterium]
MAKNRDIYARAMAENAYVQDYFESKRNGYFVEVGAHDPINFGSQSWHLENDFGWHGVLVEPIPELASMCRKYRPKSKVFECACVDGETTNTVSLFIPRKIQGGADILGRSAIEPNIDDGYFQFHRKLQVEARTFNSILLDASAGQIDLLSIDVEGAELEVLHGLDLNCYRPKLILLEDKFVHLKKYRYLKKHGYRLVKRTRENCWYVPVDAKRPPQTILEKIRLFKKMYISIWRRKLEFYIRNQLLKGKIKIV